MIEHDNDGVALRGTPVAMFIEHLLCHSGLWGTGVNVPVWLKSAFLREVGNK